MSMLVADASLHEKLGQVQDVTSIEDSTGRLLGYFTPATMSADELQTYSRAAAYFTRERMAQAKAKAGAGSTLAEFWPQLEQRKAAKCDSL